MIIHYQFMAVRVQHKNLYTSVFKNNNSEN